MVVHDAEESEPLRDNDLARIAKDFLNRCELDLIDGRIISSLSGATASPMTVGATCILFRFRRPVTIGNLIRNRWFSA